MLLPIIIIKSARGKQRKRTAEFMFVLTSASISMAELELISEIWWQGKLFHRRHMYVK